MTPLPPSHPKTSLKRMFFAFKAEAPWSQRLPQARLLQAEERHITVAFLGEADHMRLAALLPTMPLPPMQVGLTGTCDKILFLPKHHPHVIAWHVAWFSENNRLAAYSRQVLEWLTLQGFSPAKGHTEFLPHITIGRAPFDFQAWRQAFHALPVAVSSLHLYESLGQLRYQSLWSHNFLVPFEEIEHTADIAFKIRAESLAQLFYNALTALAFKCPDVLKYSSNILPLNNIDDVIIALNEAVSRTDAAIGCPFKAVSFHGEIAYEAEGSLIWEMIVDV